MNEYSFVYERASDCKISECVSILFYFSKVLSSLLIWFIYRLLFQQTLIGFFLSWICLAFFRGLWSVKIGILLKNNRSRSPFRQLTADHFKSHNSSQQFFMCHVLLLFYPPSVCRPCVCLSPLHAVSFDSCVCPTDTLDLPNTDINTHTHTEIMRKVCEGVNATRNFWTLQTRNCTYVPM